MKTIRETRAYKETEGAFDRVKPRRNFDEEGGGGAWELAVQYAGLDLGDAGPSDPAARLAHA